MPKVRATRKPPLACAESGTGSLLGYSGRHGVNESNGIDMEIQLIAGFGPAFDETYTAHE